MYCGNCGNLIDSSIVACRSCGLLLEDQSFRTDQAERIFVSLLPVVNLVSNSQHKLDSWEIDRLERMRNRGAYSFHSAKMYVETFDQSKQFPIPLEIDIYRGEFDLQEELEELHWEESQKYLAIIAGPSWFMTLEFSEDYSDDHWEVPYTIANFLGGEIVFEHDGIEPEFRLASELTELLDDFGFWSSDPEMVPKSRKAFKSWTKDEYDCGYTTFTREDGTQGKLDLHAQIFSKIEPVSVQMPIASTLVTLIGNGWMLKIVGDNSDVDFINNFAEEVAENLGCEIES